MSCRDGLRLAGEQREVRNAAAFLRQAGGRHIFETHQQGRREIDELRALIGTIVEHLRRGELARSGANLVADFGAELREQARFEPGFARTWRRRDFLRGTERHVRDFDAASQRIFGRDRANRRQRAVFALEHDARKVGQLGGLQARVLGHLKILGLQRRTRLQTQIRRQHFARLLIDRETHAAREESHRSQRRHRDQQRQHQHSQLARFAIARQCEECEPQRFHAATLPASMRIVRPHRCAIALS